MQKKKKSIRRGQGESEIGREEMGQLVTGIAPSPNWIDVDFIAPLSNYYSDLY